MHIYTGRVVIGDIYVYVYVHVDVYVDVYVDVDVDVYGLRKGYIGVLTSCLFIIFFGFRL